MITLQISFSTFHLQWTLWTIPKSRPTNRTIISDLSAKQLIKDLKLTQQEVLEDRSEENGILLGYDIYFKPTNHY